MAGAGGIRAGAAYVELYVKNNKFVRGLNQSSARLKAFGGSMMRIGAAVTAAGTAIVGPITAAAKERQEQGAKAGGKARHGDFSLMVKCPEGSTASDQAGKAFGVSGKSVDRARQVLKDGLPEPDESQGWYPSSGTLASSW